MIADETLWQQIRNFELDNPTHALTFTQRLARENGWSLEYALRTVFEYKKFIYLICISGKQLTPSDQVDQAWHLHLIYSRSYWIDLCEHTIKRQIHHGPTQGGVTENVKYTDAYQYTLDVYEKVFNKAAPSDIWPDVTTRFKNNNFRRINTTDNWIIHKPSILLK